MKNIVHTTSASLLTKLLVLSGLIMLSACSEVVSVDTEIEQYLQSAKIIEIQPTDHYLTTRDYIGKINSTEFSELRFEYAGKVDATLANNGDVVTAGQVIARQETTLLTIKRAELQAQLVQTQANIKLNNNNLTRFNTLRNDGYTAQQTIDELKAEKEILFAKTQQLNASIDGLNFQIERSSLVAPFAGTISERFVSTGEIASPNSPAFTIIRGNNEEIVVGIPAQMANKLTQEQHFSATIGGQSVKAKLINIGKQIDPLIRTVDLRLLPLNPIKHFNNQIARVTLNYQVKKAGFWLPISALTDGIRGQWNVYLVDELSNDHFQIKVATVNIVHATQTQAFVTGLEHQPQQIIATGVHRFAAGQKVKKANQALSVTDGGLN